MEAFLKRWCGKHLFVEEQVIPHVFVLTWGPEGVLLGSVCPCGDLGSSDFLVSLGPPGTTAVASGATPSGLCRNV